jgi:hypothetical protein
MIEERVLGLLRQFPGGLRMTEIKGRLREHQWQISEMIDTIDAAVGSLVRAGKLVAIPGRDDRTSFRVRS